MKARFFRLTQIHQKIDERLRAELRKRAPDNSQIADLKRLKARAKNALSRLLARHSFA